MGRVAIVAIAVLAGVVTMQNGHYSLMEQEQKEIRDELDSRMEQEQKERRNELDRRMEQEQKERRNELDSRMEQEKKERRNELDSRMEQKQKERRNELDSRMEQEQKERRNELDSRMEQEQKERHNELDSRMEQEQKERHDDLDKTLEVMHQLSEHDRQTAEGHISRLQKQQNLTLIHLKLIPWPHEDILPFEFVMKDFETHKKDADLWYSPPFYTDINGYKMCIGVNATGNTVSVSVFLMAGVADDYLKWSFQEDIKIELINQAGSSYGRRNYVKSVETTVLKSLQRVTSGERSLVVLQSFIPHDKLKFDGKKGTHYLKNDKLKFRVSVAPNVHTP